MFVYIDDIIITVKAFPEILARFETVMQRLRDGNLKMNLSKTDFFEQTIAFLGHDISAEGVRPSEYRLKAVKEFPVSKKSDDVWTIYGLASFYRNSIFRFAEIAEPLHHVMRKNATFKWDENCEKSFETLKNLLISKPIVSYPDMAKELVVYTDA